MMKKYMVEFFVTFADDDRRDSAHEVYECNGYEAAKNWTGECIRLEDVNTYKEGKRKATRKQLARGKYIPVEKMPHWKHFEVIVWENGTDNVIEKWEA